jgi:hypothetical protein
MAETVYLLCAATSIICAVLLFNGFRENRTRLLFWSSLCFIGLALNNILLFVDQVLTAGVALYLAGVELAIWRGLLALVSISMLIYGLVWEAE